MPPDSPGAPDDAADNVKIPGPLAVWQGIAAGLGGLLISAVVTTNKLEERSVADQRSMAEMRGQLSTLVSQVQQLALDVAVLRHQSATKINGNGNANGEIPINGPFRHSRN